MWWDLSQYCSKGAKFCPNYEFVKVWDGLQQQRVHAVKYDFQMHQVQALCMIEAPSPKLDNGLIFKSFFTSVISNIFGVTRSVKLSKYCYLEHFLSYESKFFIPPAPYGELWEKTRAGKRCFFFPFSYREGKMMVNRRALTSPHRAPPVLRGLVHLLRPATFSQQKLQVFKRKKKNRLLVFPICDWPSKSSTKRNHNPSHFLISDQ